MYLLLVNIHWNICFKSRLQWFIFAFISLAFGDISSKKLLQLRSKRLLPVFSSRILMVSCLTFRTFIHFEFIFVYGVRQWSRFILLHVVVQFSQHHLLKRLYSIGYSFLLHQRLVGHTFVGPVMGSLFYFTDPYVYFCANTILSWWLQPSGRG